MQDHEFAHYFLGGSALLGLGVASVLMFSVVTTDGVALAAALGNIQMEPAAADLGGSMHGFGDQHQPNLPMPPGRDMGDINGNARASGTNPAACARLQLTHTLMRGSRGDDVAQLQQMLIDQGLLASSSATGFFGALTEKAVAHWQHDEGIASSSEPDSSQGIGRVGPLTRAHIMRACSGADMHSRATLPTLGSTTPPISSSTLPMMPPPPPIHGSSTPPALLQ